MAINARYLAQDKNAATLSPVYYLVFDAQLKGTETAWA